MGLSVKEHPSDVYWISKSIHRLARLHRRTLLFLAAMGPGIITMIADNDAGGISTYAQTGAKTGFNLLWAFIILVPMAYYIQEMTVRLGAVTKRGHAEAIFDGFGKFWGWFSIFDLALINWLTLVTEYIGMTQAMRLFNIPEWITFLSVTLLLLGIVIPAGTGRLRRSRFSSASLTLSIFRRPSGPCTPGTSRRIGRQSSRASTTLTSFSAAPSHP
jgi:Mn2+/Fe2+ NRAMP family transporter